MKNVHVAIANSLRIVTILAAVFWSYPQSPVWLSTVSPAKTYRLELTGTSHRPKVPGVMNEARFNLTKSGERVVTNAPVDAYDWFDSDFAEMYPEHKWLNDYSVRFGYQVSDLKRRSDSLTVSNASDKPVRYLKITIGDMLFLFDVAPGATMDLQVPHEGWLGWVAATGTFVDGQSIPFNGANFFHRDMLKVPLHYCLTVADGKIRIASTVTDGYNGDARPEKPNLPKVARCDELARR